MKKTTGATGPVFGLCLQWLLFGCLALLMAAPSFGQSYPDRPIRLILPFPEGGGVNIVARTVGERLSEIWGQQLVHDNRPGAGSRLGAELASKAAPDGYTLLMTSISHTTSAAMYPTSYNPIESFAPITMVVSTPLALVAHPSLPAQSIKALTMLAKERPGKLNFGSSGYGGITHLAGELFNAMAGVKMVHVSYKGGAPALTDVMGGHIELLFISLPGAVPHIVSGKVRGLAVTSEKRATSIPEVPAMNESIPGYAVVNWYGILAPAGTPKQIVGKLHADIVTALRKPETTRVLVKMGSDVVGNSPAEFTAILRTDIDRWTKLVKQAGIVAK